MRNWLLGLTAHGDQAYLVPGLLLWLFASPALAEVKPAAIFADNMVLQRDLPAPVWGTADPGEKITVAIADHKAETTADEKGRWLVRLEPLAAGGPFELSIRGNNAIAIKNVLVGEVWIAGGQSNMEMHVDQAAGGAEAVAAASDPQIRVFRVAGRLATEPSRDLAGSWQTCTPENVKGWSAAGYYFAIDLRKSLNVPVALLQNAAGWTPAEAWTSRASLMADPELKPIVDTWDTWAKAYPRAKQLHEEKLAVWKAAAEAAKNAGQPAPAEPPAPWNPEFIHHPAMLFNGALHPLIPYGIRGAIWYQGETNASRADQYRRLFPTMIRDWRRAWGQGDFPFIYAQIAPLGDGDYARGVDRAELRDAQREALAEPNTAMVATVDIGEPKDEHPQNKREVGRRLALAAEKLVYGKNIVASGPLYRAMKIEGATIRLEFTNIGGSLKSIGDGPLRGFTIAGTDRKFVPATAKIDGDSIVVSAPEVVKPQAVRYAWANYPEFSLANAAGLSAPPFRTDDWPLTTKGEKRMLFEQIPLDPVTLTHKKSD